MHLACQPFTSALISNLRIWPHKYTYIGAKTLKTAPIKSANCVTICFIAFIITLLFFLQLLF